ncbi:MAG: hypothetical protein KDC34_03170 [Saprospiraceae bacterium]|nr:hypothetical protein [Saprospiraceae bacterium]
MPKKRQLYQERAEQLAKAIDIAEKIMLSSKSLDDITKTHFLNWGRELKNLALHPEPVFRKIASLKYLENDFLVYWNEAEGKDVEDFWIEIYKNGIDYERKDTIQAVLKRNKIKDVHEYDNVIDNIVVAEQIGRINTEQVIELNRLIADFEQRQAGG